MRNKSGQFAKGCKIRLGTKHKKETIDKIRLSKIGKPNTQKTKEKISIGLKRFYSTNTVWNKGVKTPPNSGKFTPGVFSGDKHHNWSGGRIKIGKYIMVYSPDHPNHHKKTKYVLEHRLIVEKSISRLLSKKEVVHHIDNNGTNNNIKNLIVFSSPYTHRLHHKTLTKNKDHIVFDGSKS